MSLQDATQSESFTRKPRRNELFRSAAAKPVMVHCRPPGDPDADEFMDVRYKLFEPLPTCVWEETNGLACESTYQPEQTPFSGGIHMSTFLWLVPWSIANRNAVGPWPAPRHWPTPGPELCNCLCMVLKVSLMIWFVLARFALASQCDSAER